MKSGSKFKFILRTQWKDGNMSYSVVKLAREIIEMQQEIDHLQGEVEVLREYEQKYQDLLHGSIRHNKTMIGGLLELAMKHAGEKQ